MKEKLDHFEVFNEAINARAQKAAPLPKLTKEEIMKVAERVHAHFHGKKVVAAAVALILFVCSGNSFANEPLIGVASFYTSASARSEGTSGTYTAWCRDGGKCKKFHDNGVTFATRRRDFGKVWKITNLDNGTWVCARHTDFGPNEDLYEAGRVIDLSRGAFLKLGGDPKKGLIRVKAQPVEACP